MSRNHIDSAPSSDGQADDDGSVRQRILDAALDEFSAKGIAGARVDSIARAARVNIRMLYYYFESKANLYREVTAGATRSGHLDIGDVPSNEVLIGILQALFGNARTNNRVVRLLQWESLERPEPAAEPGGGGERLDRVARRVELIERAQSEGIVPADLDPRMLYIALHSLALAPFAFPGMVERAANVSPSDPAFQEGYSRLLEQLASRLSAD